MLTHWGRLTHIRVSKLTSIASDNGLSPGRRQAIIWNDAGILLMGPSGTNFNEILIQLQTFSLKKIRLKMSSAKCRPFCLGLNVLNCFINTKYDRDPLDPCSQDGLTFSYAPKNTLLMRHASNFSLCCDVGKSYNTHKRRETKYMTILRARNRYQGQGQVITSHGICGIQLIVPVRDTCIWHTSTHIENNMGLMSQVHLGNGLHPIKWV